MVRWITILLSVIGLSVGVWAVATADEKKPDLPLARAAAVNPYERGVAALGTIEPGGKGVSIQAPEVGLVVEVFVDVGDDVKAGDPLFRLDTRRLEADLVRAEAAVAAGEAEVARWHALPRAEDVPPLEAAAAATEALWKDREELRLLTIDAARKGSGTDRDVSRATFQALVAKSEFDRAAADLAKVKSGGWKPDLAVAESKVAGLRAEVQALRLLMDRLTVRAPRDGKVLRRQIEPGEFASADPGRSAIILGDLSVLNVRAQVDEEDIGLIRAGELGTPGPAAVARTRGAIVADLPLELIRIEPFARPKSDLIGTNLERVDTRVIDVLFRIKGEPKTRVYPGQAVDVFIEAPR
jgi:multidrug efflux pump subunit AcrA (membrane-fusion protein)